MRKWQLGGLVAAAALVLVLGLIPMVGGPRPGRLVDRTTDAECVRAEDGGGYRGAPVRSAKAAWVWSSGGYGWGCRYEYTDGVTGETVWPR